MAIAYAINPNSRRDCGRTTVDITLDGSYPANGYVISAASCGMFSIDSLDAWFTTGEGFACAYIGSSGKLKMFKNAAGAGAFTECANTDLTSAMKVRCDVAGTPIL